MVRAMADYPVILDGDRVMMCLSGERFKWSVSDAYWSAAHCTNCI